MINKLISKSVSIFLILVLIFGLIPAALFAQPSTAMSGQNLPGFNKSVFDSHFSKADRELSPDRWLFEAQLGITQAIHAWELAACSLFDNPLLFEEARNQLEKWSNEELEIRFSQWLIGRFFGETAEKALMEISLKLSESQKKYTWYLDEEGNIIFDDKTGVPLVIRPDDNREFSRDLLMWREEADKIVKDGGFSLNNVLENLYTELLAYIPDSLRDRMSSLIKETGADISNSLKREFENIAAREERILTSRRTRDIWSLRKQNDDEAARLFTQSLIAETENICMQGIEELNAKIEAAYAGTGDLAIMGEEWLRLYKEQFERGLKAWEEAEERFFIRRIEWEQDSARLLWEGEEIWMEAFDRFQEQQRNWELQAKALFESGEALFMNISNDFSRNIAEAKKEFELNMAMRIGEGTEKVKALIDMYITCSSAALSAKGHLEYLAGLPNNEEEVNKTKLMYESYMEKALDARGRILDNYAELLGTGVLKDILSPDSSSEDFFLDEYQIALVRAQALVVYWERKTEIAEAVIEYAQELSAYRITEAEGRHAWEAARSAYNDSLAVYEAELTKLNNISYDMQKQQVILNELALKMQAEEEKLNKLNQEYSALFAVSVTSQNYLHLLDLNTKYNLLTEGYKKYLLTGDKAIYIDAIEYGMNWSIAEQKKSAQSIYEILMDIDDDEETALDLKLKQAAIYMLTEDISGKDWYYIARGTALKENSVYEQLKKDAEQFSLTDEAKDDKDLNDYNYCLGLLELYERFSESGSVVFIQKEKWQITLNSLNSLFERYNLEETDTILPDIQNIFDTVENIPAFLSEFEKCVSDVPEWLKNEIDNWKDAIIKYCNTLSFDNDEKAKNWRQYLAQGYIEDIDPETSYAATWKEGMIEDAKFFAVYYTNRLNDALSLFSGDSFNYSGKDAAYYSNLYFAETAALNRKIDSLSNLFKDIAYTGGIYDSSISSFYEIEGQLLVSKAALESQKDIYNTARDKYLSEAGVFLNIGSLYDIQYSVLKKAHENSDQKRFEYEKQDAIQRWAGTAYLGVDLVNYENCKTKLERARTVLLVLSDLYNNETLRPYENREYDMLYAEYQQSFDNRIRTREAIELLQTAIELETKNNNMLYAELYKTLNEFGGHNFFTFDYSGYESSSDLKEWNIYDLITVKDGQLVFLTDEGYTFTGVEKKDADNLVGYFNTEYRDSVIELNKRMSVYFQDEEKYGTWSMARQYLGYLFKQNNADLTFLNSYFSVLGELDSGRSVGEIIFKIDLFGKAESLYSELNIYSMYEESLAAFQAAWESLSENEKKDLEFYTILTLTQNRNDYYYGFLQEYTAGLYNRVYDRISMEVSSANESLRTLGIASFLTLGAAAKYIPLYKEKRDLGNHALGLMSGVRDETNMYVNNWINGLKNSFVAIDNLSAMYSASYEKLESLYGIKTDSYVTWSDLEKALKYTEKYNPAEINELKKIWDMMQADNTQGGFLRFSNNFDALAAMYFWSGDKEDNVKMALETCWQNNFYIQQINEAVYLSMADAYMAGEIDISLLKSAAQNAYGSGSASLKNHLNNMNSALIADLSIYSNLKANLPDEFAALCEELSGYIAETLYARYYAEFSAREIEWQQIMKDINDKYNEWLSSASLIFENGRNDWNESLQKLKQSYNQWQVNFREEYSRVSDEWDMAYLAGLEDKENWLAMAAKAADQASAEAFLSLVGTEGERLSRMVDAREPFSIRNAEPQAHAIMTELLQSSGIVNMYNAFSSINNIANTASTIAARGMGGYSVWDTGLVKTAAADLAKKTNEEIAERETRMLALNARQTAEDAVKNLETGVAMANENFRLEMDNVFIFKGLWRRSGSDYLKEIVKGSTFFNPVISQTVIIPGYENYILEPVSLRTNTDESYLLSLNTAAIMGIIENIYFEIRIIADEIFGNEVSGGKFGKHIGQAPDNERNKNDKGDGELGRLMYEFYYWFNIDREGSAQLLTAPWEKRMWDDSGSWFPAPSLRLVGTIASAVAAVALTCSGYGTAIGAPLLALIAASSVIMFETLDVLFEYKTLGEGLFNIGKSYLTSLATTAVSGAFSGVNGLTNTAVSTVNSSIGKVITKTAMTGLENVTTSLISTTLDSFTYSSKDGFGWSNDIFESGLNSMFKNTLTSMAGTFTTSSLSYFNVGENAAKLLGFSNANTKDVETFNSLTGSLVGQGVSYALGDDFTINILNLSQFTKGNYKAGLLELHFGREGVTMNLGTGGADTSFGTLVSALKGIDILNTNYIINKYVKENDEINHVEFLRLQYGYGDDKQIAQLKDILKGNTLLKTNTNGDLSARTIIDENGNRVIIIGGYQTEMRIEEIFRLGAILGHEAYRDGYKIGQIDAYGNMITQASNNLELYNASIARVMMSNRINDEHIWYYKYNVDFAFESALLNDANKTGDYSLFNDYLQIVYLNNDDYFFQRTSTRNQYQNVEAFRNIPLFNALTEDAVNEINEQRKSDAYERYINKKIEDGEDFLTLSDFKKDTELLKNFGYDPLQFISLRNYGCRFMSTIYGLEAITGTQIDPLQLHDLVYRLGYFTDLSLLSNQDMINIMSYFSNGKFDITLENTDNPNIEQLYNLESSQLMYLACLQVNGASGGAHYVMLDKIDFTFDYNGNVTEISSVHVSNPWNDINSKTGKQSYTMDEINRWDIFRIIPVNTLGFEKYR